MTGSTWGVAPGSCMRPRPWRCGEPDRNPHPQPTTHNFRTTQTVCLYIQPKPAVVSCRMSRHAAPIRRRWSCLLVLAAVLAGSAASLRAYGPQGFDTVVIDAGHGGYDLGGGPGQRIAESTYTLDTARRLQRALRSRGFRTVMTRDQDVFVTLRDRVAIGASYRNAVFVSVHYNSGSRLDAHGYETYYYRSDSFGLASRLHTAQLASLNTEDRHVRRRGFYVLRNPSTPAVLCEGGFLTNPGEASTIMSSSYRERWAQNIAAALVEQRRFGDPTELGYQPPVTTEHFSSGRRSSSSRGRSHGRSRGGHHTRGRSSGGRSHGRSTSGSRHGRSSSGSHHSSGKSTSKKKHH